MCVCVQWLIWVLLFADSMDYSPPGSSVHGVLQARILEWIAISFSRESARPINQTCVYCIGTWILYHWTLRGAQKYIRWQKTNNQTNNWGTQLLKINSFRIYVVVLVPQLCPTLWPHGITPASSAHGIFLARVLEWVAISFSRRSSRPRDRTRVSCTAGWFFTNWATRTAPWNST